jgi:dTMP kinase
MPPLFITFEGIDGSGKSTHLKRAAEWLAQHGVACRQTHEPGGTPLGDALRQLFLDRRWGALDGTVELLMLFASRRQHLLEVIEPALAAGEIVLCDRFTDSTCAYQGRGRGVPLELIDQVDLLATGRRRPDRTLLFDLPAAAARARRHGSRPGDPDGPRAVPGGRRGRADRADRLDAEDLAFYERVRQGFLEQAQREPRRFRIVESGGDPARTAAQVRAALEDLLPAGVVRA